MSELHEMAIVKGIQRNTNLDVAHISYRHSLWGWLQSRSMLRAEWEMIGKEMGWFSKEVKK